MQITEPILGIKCKKCGLLQHYSHIRCLKCKNDSFDKIEATGDCVLLTYTILNSPPAEFRDKQSYSLGIVEFENGVRTLGQIPIKNNLSIGMKLQPLYKKICENLDGKEVNTYVFEPI